MATLLDVGLFEHFGVIFPFIFAVVLSYAVFEHTKIMGDNRAINAMISMVIGVLFMMSDSAILLVKFMTPWFVLLFIFLFMMFTVFGIFGAREANFREVILNNKVVIYWVISVSLLILILGLGSVYGDSLSPYTESGTVDTQGFEADAWSTFFHPKVIGLIFLSMVGAFTIIIIAGDSNK